MSIQTNNIVILVNQPSFEITSDEDFRNKLYNEIKKSIKNNKILDTNNKKKLYYYAKTNLPEYVDYSRLDKVFESFINTYSDKIKKITLTQQLYYRETIEYKLDNILWSGTYEIEVESIYDNKTNKYVELNCLDIKLLNDGFIYSGNIHEKNPIIPRHNRDYKRVELSDQNKFPTIINFLKTKKNIKNPIIFLCEHEDRIDFQAKNFQTNQAVSITFEYGLHNTYIDRDEWN